MADTGKNHSFIFPPDFRVDQGRTGYGIAFDMGTTTVAGLLFDLEKGSLLGTVSRGNPQTVWGKDVISRISHGLEGEEKLRLLQQSILACMEEMMGELLEGAQCRAVTIAGNPAMCHFLLGISPEGLARAPFVPAFGGLQRRAGSALFHRKGVESEVCILPGIGGHVGGDMTAVYGYVTKLTGEKEAEHPLLILDLGTNGEIMALGAGRAVACSAAAGPALEGGAVCRGMQGIPGAIETVWADGDELGIKVIGEGVPRGICGSGLVDTLAVLLDTGLMDETGYLLSRQEGEEKGLSRAWTKRLTEWEGQNAFVLSEENPDIILTLGDIRQLQLAKGAIRAGIETLLHHLHLKAHELAALYLAGAFGNYIRKTSAMRIGLLPEMDQEKVIPIGNGAGIGAGMALLSAEFTADLERYAGQAVHVELADEPDFQERFMDCLHFPFGKTQGS